MSYIVIWEEVCHIFIAGWNSTCGKNSDEKNRASRKLPLLCQAINTVCLPPCFMLYVANHKIWSSWKWWQYFPSIQKWRESPSSVSFVLNEGPIFKKQYLATCSVYSSSKALSRYWKSCENKLSAASRKLFIQSEEIKICITWFTHQNFRVVSHAWDICKGCLKPTTTEDFGSFPFTDIPPAGNSFTM